ncbi:MAG: hypothetical protein JWM61_1616, partial [Micrococcaceae bacterium]|nr:hypothetical protein [Micrococcaceae bacterium]
MNSLLKELVPADPNGDYLPVGNDMLTMNALGVAGGHIGGALSRSRASRNAALSSGFNDEPEHFLCPGNQGVVMAGKFELFRDGGVSFRFRLKAPNGTVVAVSKQYSDKASAVEG